MLPHPIKMMGIFSCRGLLIPPPAISPTRRYVIQLFGESSKKESMLHPSCSLCSDSILQSQRRFRFYQALDHDGSSSEARTFSTSCYAMSRFVKRFPRWPLRVGRRNVRGKERESEAIEEFMSLRSSNDSLDGKLVNKVVSDPGFEGTFVMHGSQTQSNAVDQRIAQRPVQVPKDNLDVPVSDQSQSGQERVSPDSWNSECQDMSQRLDRDRKTRIHGSRNVFKQGRAIPTGQVLRDMPDTCRNGEQQGRKQTMGKDTRIYKSKTNDLDVMQGRESSSEVYPGPNIKPTDVETVSADLLEMDSRKHSGARWKSTAEDQRSNQENEKRSSSLHHRERTKEQIRIPRGRDLLYGISPCFLALKHAKREVHQLYVTSTFQNSQRPEVKEILALVEERGLRMWQTNRRVLDRFTEQRRHQGMCMETSRLYFDSLLDEEGYDDFTSTSVRLVLDQIHDPMNLGALLRSAYFLGIDKVVVSKKNCCSLTPVVSKASSGVMEIMPVYAAPHIPSYLENEKQKGWSVVGASVGSCSSSNESIPCNKYKQTGPTLLVVGNEGFGLSNDIIEQCSEFISVPAGRQLHAGIDSLNVSVATGILLHSILGRR
ncbi:uncharacterized tRNA/rRNA methyltransferase slr0955-like [Lytechinus variegatus]|uniref:uncharacterized tRNA/rRNA methyltransferase slr0955-like n=1 Tax=Lytechinus variegatus TaxID=7654 RepID=UPI001BB10042|nr:uncharacterized tRNA/rRNA methyltransferase slr0955-like [Lytechinus variegatus]